MTLTFHHRFEDQTCPYCQRPASVRKDNGWRFYCERDGWEHGTGYVWGGDQPAEIRFGIRLRVVK